jgi:hypothetical protein
MLSRDQGLLNKALSMCPEDTPVRKMLIEFNLSFANYATHHLNESRLLGSVDEVTASLTHARDLIANAPELPPLAHLIPEVHHLETQLADWIAYSQNAVGSFPEWCAKQGRNYNYPTRVYYGR